MMQRRFASVVSRLVQRVRVSEFSRVRAPRTLGVFERLENRELLAADLYGGCACGGAGCAACGGSHSGCGCGGSGCSACGGAHGAHHHPHVLFNEGTPPEYIAKFQDGHGDEPSHFRYGGSGRWDGTTSNGGGLGNGDPTTLTWSIVPDGTSIGGFAGEPASPSNLVARMRAIYGDTDTDTDYTDEAWFQPYAETMERWNELSGLNYVYEPNDDGVPLATSAGQLGVRGDVRIGGHTIDNSGGILAYNFFPDNGDMVIDTADGFYNSISNNSLRLRNVLAHEAGHGFGLAHVESNNAGFLMEPFINLGFDGPQFDDVLGAHRGYGDAWEGNDTSGTATSLGTIASGGSVTFGDDADGTAIAPSESAFVSIDDDSDVDFFSFTISGASLLDVTLTPEGPTYNEGPQNGSQSPFNTSALSNLGFEILDTDGTTVLTTVNANGLGVAEELDDFSLNGAGTYYARIFGDANQVQMYSLDIGVVASAVQPEIQVEESSADVADGATIDYGTTLPGVALTKTFTITNTGGGTLNLGALSSMPSGFTLVTDIGDSTLAASESTTFEVRLDAINAGVYNGEITFSNNDADENPFNIFIAGVVAPPPVIIDNGDTAHSTSNDWQYRTNGGYQGDYIFDYRGSGSHTSTWTFDDLVPGLYNVAVTWPSNFAVTSDAPFTVYDGGSALGTVDVDQRIAPNDFSDAGAVWESLGDFTITSSSLSVILTDDASQLVMGDAVRLQLVSQTPAPEIGVTVDGGDVTDGATSVDFGFVPLNSPLTKTFTIKNEGTSTLNIGAFDAMPSGFTLVSGVDDNTLAPGQTTSFDIRLDATALGSYSGAVSFVTNDGDENPFNFNIEGIVASADAEITVLDGGTNIVDGTTLIDFGDTEVGTPVFKTFTVRNDGLSPLNLTGFLPEPSGFTITTGLSSNTLTTGQTATFTVRLDAAAEGDFSGAISLNNNDSDENPFDIQVTGTVDPLPFVGILDNGDPGYSESNNWQYRTNGGYLGDYAFDYRGSGSHTATWTFTGLIPGEYSVAVTWPQIFAVTDDAPFTVKDGPTNLATIDKSQKSPPNDFTDAGVPWELLGNFVITTDTLSVVLSDDAQHIVVGDAVRIELLAETPRPEVEVAVDGGAVLDGVTTVDFGVTPVGSPVAKTFTVSNDGDATLNLGAFDAMPPGFSLTSGFGDNTLEPGESTDFTVTLDAVAASNYSGTISFANNDDDENPFDIDVTGLVATLAAEITVLDGGTNIADGTGNVTFAGTTVGTPVQKTFTVRNDGITTLTLGAIDPLPSGFSLVSGFSSNSLTTGQTATFVVEVDAVAAGTYSGTLSFANSDPDEDPFDFTIEATVNPNPIIEIIDNNDTGYSRVGSWQYRNNDGYLGDYEYNFRGSGADRGVWTFSVVPGIYNVAATWPDRFGVTDDAPYSVFDGATLLGTVDLNQKIQPNDFAASGAVWENIGQFTITGTTLVVELSDDASQLVMADAIRIEQQFNNFQSISAGPGNSPQAAIPFGEGDSEGERAFSPGEGGVVNRGASGANRLGPIRAFQAGRAAEDYWRYRDDVQASFADDSEDDPWWKL